ncbi:MAG: FlgD immunoglobulin-like domain containing protein [Candidatus Eisenbacteria bacterium]
MRFLVFARVGARLCSLSPSVDLPPAQRSWPSLIRPLVYFCPLLVPLASHSALAEPTPPLAWSDIWSGPGGHDDESRAIAVEPGGAVYVGGSTYDNSPGVHRNDYFLHRYSADGTLEWTRFLDPETSNVLTAIVASPGRVVVTGTSGQLGSSLVTVAFDDAGNLLWEDHVPLTGTQFISYPPTMTRDDDGNLVVAAHSAGDYLVVKYAPTGQLLWTASYDGPAGDDDFAADVAADTAGNVYVTGLVTNASQFDPAFVTVKFDADGVFQWEQAEEGDFGSVFEYVSLEIGPDDAPVMTGSGESTCGLFQVRVWKCDPVDGTQLWLASFPPDPCGSVTPAGMGIDTDGSIYVAASGGVDGLNGLFHTLKYASDGTTIWQRSWGWAETTSNVARAITMDGAGNVYIAGETAPTPQDRDYVAVKYSPAGEELWEFRWPDPQGTVARVGGTAVSNTGDVFITGYVYDPVQQFDAATLCLRQQDPADVFPSEAMNERPRLGLGVTQNPIREDVLVRYELSLGGAAGIGIYDTAGRLVWNRGTGVQSAGQYEVRWDGTGVDGASLPSGVYYVRLTTAREGASTIAVRLLR